VTTPHARNPPAFLFDLDGTLVDSVYQHVLALQEALECCGIELAIWRIHRRVGMSGGPFASALLRETGKPVTDQQAQQLQRRHAEDKGSNLGHSNNFIFGREHIY
jgi:beta-phosphoglucomutase-like phosphatase (HAD superfamily)